MTEFTCGVPGQFSANQGCCVRENLPTRASASICRGKISEEYLHSQNLEKIYKQLFFSKKEFPLSTPID
ncbi:hypothetical protein CIT292_10997 [Citrobacter youngae ATCC 29220]|uniref:Uncharacterized protein n=1 Tax=Citrobacter youngae ATCC 29220 TaxID=500640 RepID=D4BKC0_9ENTR|nr:hypothetical protein CIT292_10997 [Citrobacter youngae ATCC 29220]